MKTAHIIEKNLTLSQAAKIMSSNKISAIIYVSKGNIKGILTEKDLVRNFNKNKKIKEIMNPNVITITEEEDINKALELMRHNKIKKLPVVNKNTLSGIITLTDIAANAEELEEDFFFE
jgi:CBS domain-containing protein